MHQSIGRCISQRMAQPAKLRRAVAADAPKLAAAAPATDAATEKVAAEIIADVRARGKAAVLEHAVRLGDIKEGDPLFLDPPALEAAFKSLPLAQQQLLERIAVNIKTFAAAQRKSVHEFDVAVRGGRAGQTVEAVSAAGCYAPGGRYPLPSSVLMTAVTARAAGVAHVAVASPKPATITLAAAHVARVDKFVVAGGAQAIAALALGVGTELPPALVVVGPGNKYVTAAKRQLVGTVGIDMLAGPSEVLVLADSHAMPEVVAADLIAQAEHDVDARPLLVTWDESLVAKVEAALEKQLSTLSTAAVARESISRHGVAVVCADEAEALRVADQLAPEHLELHVKHADALKHKLKNYGGLFVGELAAEVFGDYGIGPNHVLPTGGTAKFSGGLSVHSFLRVRTWMRLDNAASELRPVVEDTAAFARLEGLEGHARASEQRLEILAKAAREPLPRPLALASDSELVKIGLPKGRMEASVNKLLDDAGIKIKVDPRGYRPTLNIQGFEVKLLKPQNIVEMLHAGSRDVGFTGADLVSELNVDNLVSILDTGLDPVRIVAAVPEALLNAHGHQLPRDRRLVIATEYLNTTRRWVERKGLNAAVVHSRGATEGWPPDDADFIVDNTATGSTLKANGLEIIDELLTSNTHLFAHPSAMQHPAKRRTIEKLLMLLKSAMNARERILLEFHVPADKLNEVVAYIPAMKKPTVSTLHEGAGYALKVAVPRADLHNIIATLKAHGASDIIATNLVHVVP